MGYDLTDVAPLALFGYMDNAIENFSRTVDGAETYVSGAARMVYVNAYRTLSITQLGACTRGVAVSGLTGTRLGLYIADRNDDLTLVARTALLTSGVYGSTFTMYSIALDTTGGFPSSYTMIKGQRYAFGIFITFTTTSPSMKANFSNNPSPLNAMPPRIAGNLTSQSDLPLTVAASSLSNPGNVTYMYALA